MAAGAEGTAAVPVHVHVIAVLVHVREAAADASAKFFPERRSIQARDI